MTQSLIQHQSCQSCIFQRSYFCSLARVAHDCSLLINCLSPTHARPGSRTHVRVQGRNLCRFKHAHPGFRPSSIFVFSCIKKLLSGQRSFYSPFNARKRRKKTNSSRVPGRSDVVVTFVKADSSSPLPLCVENFGIAFKTSQQA